MYQHLRDYGIKVSQRSLRRSLEKYAPEVDHPNQLTSRQVFLIVVRGYRQISEKKIKKLLKYEGDRALRTKGADGFDEYDEGLLKGVDRGSGDYFLRPEQWGDRGDSSDPLQRDESLRAGASFNADASEEQ